MSWRGDSHRHYLAAKGIKTKLYVEKPLAQRIEESKPHEHVAARTYVWDILEDGNPVLYGPCAKCGTDYKISDVVQLERAKREYRANKVDLKKYSGTWEQVSVDPVPPFQKGLRDVKAKYELKKDGSVKVVNTGVNEEGRVEKIEGVAKSVSKDNRQLEVQFGSNPIAKLFMRGKYNIKKVDAKYTKATVEGGGYTWRLKKVQ